MLTLLAVMAAAVAGCVVGFMVGHRFPKTAEVIFITEKSVQFKTADRHYHTDDNCSGLRARKSALKSYVKCKVCIKSKNKLG